MGQVNEAARARFEDDVRALCKKGDFVGASTLALRGYGPEIFGFLVATHRSETEASDVFAETAEGIWKGLPTFGWESTLRTWAYAIARNVTRTRRRDAARRDRRRPRAGDSALEGVAQAVRTETLAFLRTEKKTQLQALRDALSEEDRALLVLRVDRQLAWNDLARVFREEDGVPLSEADLLKEAARLRKRFQLVKDRLRQLAKSQGLIEP